MSQPASVLERPVPAAFLRWEPLLLSLLAWALLVSIPVSLGQLGIGWDDLNHHIYLGWTAQRQRFDLDFLGAGYQSSQWPYLYWPIYRMASSGMGGVAAGAVLASLQALAVPAVWMVARACVPGGAVFDVALRLLATALALLSGVVLSSFDASMNDLLAAIPLVWAVALALEPVARGPVLSASSVQRYVLLSGLCAGLAVAFKLSNGMLAVWMPALWLLAPQGWRERATAVLLGCAATLAAFGAAYGYWGWVLWRHFGNPFFPFYDHWFAPLRQWLVWVG